MKNLTLLLFCIIWMNMNSQQPNYLEKSKDTAIADTVEILPEFPGGEAGLMEFLQKNIKYPAYAMENDIQGLVMVKFVICADGSICQAQVTKTPDSIFNSPVLDIIKNMPNWKPGVSKGVNVPVYYDLPVRFHLEDGGGDEEKLTLSKEEIKYFQFSKTNKVKSFYYSYKNGELIKVSSDKDFKKLEEVIDSSNVGDEFYFYKIKLKGKNSYSNSYRITVK